MIRFEKDSAQRKVAALAAATKREELLKTKFEFPRCPGGSAGFRDPPPYHRFVVCLGFQRYDSPFEMVVKNCKRGCRWVDFLGSFFLENGSDSASSYTISICKFMPTCSYLKPFPNSLYGLFTMLHVYNVYPCLSNLKVACFAFWLCSCGPIFVQGGHGNPPTLVA